MRFLFLIMSVFMTISLARVDDYYAEAQAIKDIINQSIHEYESGDNLKAKKLAEDAYFQHFENIEGSIGRNVGKRVISMERKFTTLRKYYKDKEDIKKIKALVSGLYFDLDEVIPIVQNGFRLKAEPSDINYDKKAAEESSIKENAKREAAADDIFARLLQDEDNISSSNTTITAQNQNDANQNTNIVSKENQDIQTVPSNDEIVAQLQNASSIDPKLQMLFDNFSLKLDEAAMSFTQNNIQEAKNLINSALFDDYRNSKLEILINKNTKAGMDQKIQQSLRQILMKLDDENLTEKAIRESFENVKETLFDAMLLIPQNLISQIKVDGFSQEDIKTKDYTKVVSEIKSSIDLILSKYETNSAQTSINDLQSVYLDIFEASGMENKIGAVDSNLKLNIESKFTNGVALIKSHAPKEELKKCFDELIELINSSLDKIGNSSPIFLFLAAFGILLREGLEALIIVVAIVSYLIQSGNSNRLNIAYSAIFTGIFLSFVTAFVIYYMFREYAGQFRELLEGITFLIAVMLLLYVGFWLLHKAESKKWSQKLQTMASDAISKNSARALWITLFLAVYREGAETVLFYQALLFDANTNSDFASIFGGLIVASIVLIVLYFLLKAGAIKIPIKLFFKLTSYIIFYMCVVFTGKGIAELIEGKIIIPTFLPIKFEPITWLGFYPYYETLTPQIIVLIILIVGVFITKKLNHKGEIK